MPDGAELAPEPKDAAEKNDPPSASEEALRVAAQACSDEQLLAALKETLKERKGVLQDLVVWATPDHVFGSARSVTDNRWTGYVKSFSDMNRFGFIISPEIMKVFGKELYVNERQMNGFGRGDEVTFAILLNKGKPQAFDLKRPDSSRGSKAGASGSRPGKGDHFVNGAPKGDGYFDDKGKGKGPHPYLGDGYHDDGWGKGCWGPDWGYDPAWGPDWGPDWGAGPDYYHGHGAPPPHPGGAYGCGPPDGYGKGSQGEHWGGLNDAASRWSPQSAQQAKDRMRAEDSLKTRVHYPGVTDRRHLGTVRSFKEGNRFGFLNCDEGLQEKFGQDIYVHWTYLGKFRPGDRVFFSVIMNERGGIKAVDLESADEGFEPRPEKWPRMG